ncbi:MAG: hypothetical protein NZ519_00365 [Bacteroidia bacterium]|nr:hypothetical protein [Bacteroidia bacterium]MDW8300823.1 hypothetical protein [Bacteroidia bacterium]
MITKRKVPKNLVYEIAEGKPIFYKGYKEALQNKKSIENVVGSSALQSFIIGKLSGFLWQKLSKDYQIFTNEVGIQLEKSTRTCNIAIFEKIQLQGYVLQELIDLQKN